MPRVTHDLVTISISSKERYFVLCQILCRDSWTAGYPGMLDLRHDCHPIFFASVIAESPFDGAAHSL